MRGSFVLSIPSICILAAARTTCKVFFLILLAFSFLSAAGRTSLPVQARVTNLVGTLALAPFSEEAVQGAPEEVMHLLRPLLSLLPRYQVMIWNAKSPVTDDPEIRKMQEEYTTINMLAPVVGFLAYSTKEKKEAFSQLYAEGMAKMREYRQDSALAKAIVSVNAVMDLVHESLRGDILESPFFASKELEEKFLCYYADYLAHIERK